MRYDAVDFKNDTITIKHTVIQVNKEVHKLDMTKNKSSCAVLPLPNLIKCRLKEWKLKQAHNRLLQPNDYIDEDYICTQIDGSLIKPNYGSQHFTLFLKNNNLPIIRFHDLRHSAAGYLKYLGFDLKDIQTWLRHSDINTTGNIYVNLDMDDKNNIADRLNKRYENFN